MDGTIYYTIYKNPSDFPGKFVIRAFTIKPKAAIAHSSPFYVGPSADACRKHLSDNVPGLFPIPRSPTDDPVIVETWI